MDGSWVWGVVRFGGECVGGRVESFFFYCIVDGYVYGMWLFLGFVFWMLGVFLGFIVL